MTTVVLIVNNSTVYNNSYNRQGFRVKVGTKRNSIGLIIRNNKLG